MFYLTLFSTYYYYLSLLVFLKASKLGFCLTNFRRALQINGKRALAIRFQSNNLVRLEFFLIQHLPHLMNSNCKLIEDYF